MFSSMTGELARPRQDDLLAAAQYQRLVREVRDGRPNPARLAAAALLVGAARWLVPAPRDRQHEVASVIPELPCAVSAC